MTRWLVFDPATAASVEQSGCSPDVQSTNVASALDAAVQQQRTVVLVVPAGPDRTTVARITPPQRSIEPRGSE